MWVTWLGRSSWGSRTQRGYEAVPLTPSSGRGSGYGTPCSGQRWCRPPRESLSLRAPIWREGAGTTAVMPERGGSAVRPGRVPLVASEGLRAWRPTWSRRGTQSSSSASRGGCRRRRRRDIARTQWRRVPAVLLHGHPRTHTTWYRVAPLLVATVARDGLDDEPGMLRSVSSGLRL